MKRICLLLMFSTLFMYGCSTNNDDRITNLEEQVMQLQEENEKLKTTTELAIETTTEVVIEATIVQIETVAQTTNIKQKQETTKINTSNTQPGNDNMIEEDIKYQNDISNPQNKIDNIGYSDASDSDYSDPIEFGIAEQEAINSITN